MKKCNSCGTENEEIYRFCKNCGKELQEPEAEHNSYESYNSHSGMNYEMNIPDIDGISSDEMSVFLGAKWGKILPKFAKMELSGSKTSFCWPAAIWSYLLGPVGAAVWFLYRKMYKIAILLFAIGIIISGATAVLGGYLSDGETATMDDIIAIYEEYMNGDIDTEEYFNQIYSLESSASTVLSNATNIATAIITGIFAYNWYKKFAVKKIKKLRASDMDSRYYLFALSAAGGTNAGAVILGFVIYFLIIAALTVGATILMMI